MTISAPPAATIDGVPYTLVGWSDGGAASHEMTVPADHHDLHGHLPTVVGGSRSARPSVGTPRIARAAVTSPLAGRHAGSDENGGAMRCYGMSRRWAATFALALAVATTGMTATSGAAPAAANLPSGFHTYTVLSGLNQPTNVEFAPDGRLFVAEKRGVVKLFDGPGDPTPTVLADLRTKVFNGWDRGLLGLAIAPDFATDPAVYVLYTLDRKPGGTVPSWGKAGQDVDNCPTPPGYTENGCVVMGRLSKLLLESDGLWHGREKVLIEDWCQQYPSHSVGSLAFGPDGSLYVSGGDGASFNFVDYGQAGSPRNPCGDAPAGVGGVQRPATSEGGALRAQEVRTWGDPTSAGGSILRVDPDTGAPMADNPLIKLPYTSSRRVVAYGFRNPFRFTLKPGTTAVGG